MDCRSAEIEKYQLKGIVEYFFLMQNSVLFSLFHDHHIPQNIEFLQFDC